MSVAAHPVSPRETSQQLAESHPTETKDDLAALRGLVRGLEDLIRIPGTKFGIGLDAILGFIAPGVGDAVTGAASLSVLFTALKRGAPKVILLRMLLNIAIDVVGGLIPGIGDAFDVVWRANVKNMELLERYEADRKALDAAPAASAVEPYAASHARQTVVSPPAPPRSTTFGDYAIVLGAIALVGVSIAAPFVFFGWVLGQF